MFKSFQTRLIVFVLALLALIQLGTAFAVLSSLKKENYRQGIAAIDVSRNVFDLFLASRAEQLIQGVEILASDFGFRQAVATRETQTLRSALENNSTRIHADFSLLVTPTGEIITATRDFELDETTANLLQAARRSGNASISTKTSYGPNAYQLVLVPVKAPNVVAWVGMAFVLDKALAEEIKSVAGLDISFIYNTTNTEEFSGQSTLPEADKNLLLKSLGDIATILKTPVFSDNEEYLSLGVDLKLPNHWGVINLPYGPWLESYKDTRNQLLLVFSGTLTLAILLGLIFARNMTKPINRLVNYASQIGQSINKSKLEAPKMTGEFGVLSKTMEQMKTAIISREKELTYRASHDTLTGLYNQSAVELHLAEVLPKTQGGMILVNIRHFKNLNNMLGVDIGNLLLSKVAERLSNWSQDVHMLARLNSDKFLLILEQDISLQDCESIKSLFNPEFETESASGVSSCMRLDVSIAVLPFVHATNNVNTALRRLDIISDKARAETGLCEFYEQGQDEDHQRQLTIIRDLSEALASNQLFVVYQPKVGLKNKDCHEAEALIRWIHPDLGFLPPDEFITLLEHAGNIQELTKWILNSVLEQLSQWWAQGHQIRVAINLSTHDLLDDELPKMVEQALEANNLPPQALALEVTESAVMKDREKVIAILQSLREMGVHLAIDDFGTGQSSLAYLHDLPVNEVKIDRAFIQFMDTNKCDEFIAKASIDLSHALGFQVTAEGAENTAGVSLLEKYKCEKVQGYVFSKPLVADEFFQWREDFHNTAHSTED
ncbi:EAL domain-containing protein [Marinomonas sp. C2222]|uniref:EAL domain-containing protein n=1 Tax=Marinomonas sargassi TaxID=2984494 RepID=A0ABT2YVP4_9GAMM|nr:EAL domain-containing protein [Marinomonas sargassi]MCV2403963.1 EAL domain-containing protein [Marinomonas sargassi]